VQRVFEAEAEELGEKAAQDGGEEEFAEEAHRGGPFWGWRWLPIVHMKIHPDRANSRPAFSEFLATDQRFSSGRA
jgi:hypothetical protein